MWEAGDGGPGLRWDLGGDFDGRLLLEAHPLHVPPYREAVVLLPPVADARIQLGCLLLSSEDVDAVLASRRAPFPLEHRPAVGMVVLECSRA